MASKKSTINNDNSYPVEAYKPRHTTWPYQPSDFTRHDPTPDTDFYSSPRFVTHIDDAAIASLRQYYDTALPKRGRILDLCSSWISHYPESVAQAAAGGELRITGLGLNDAELKANKALNGGRAAVDLNADSDVGAALRRARSDARDSGGDDPSESQGLDATTCVVSIDYLTDPVAVLAGVRAATKRGGSVHLAISNRCFPTKAVARWLRVDEAERLRMVGDYLHFAGWEGIEVVVLSDGTMESGEGGDDGQTGLKALMGLVGMRGRDPLWVVRAVKGG